MFSMVGTIFLWMFWPSFNSAAAADGEPRHRAILNTYFSLCACVLGAFAVSGLDNKHSKFVMVRLSSKPQKLFILNKFDYNLSNIDYC